jgi:hypothetical protein
MGSLGPLRHSALINERDGGDSLPRIRPRLQKVTPESRKAAVETSRLFGGSLGCPQGGLGRSYFSPSILTVCRSGSRASCRWSVAACSAILCAGRQIVRPQLHVTTQRPPGLVAIRLEGASRLRGPRVDPAGPAPAGPPADPGRSRECGATPARRQPGPRPWRRRGPVRAAPRCYQGPGQARSVTRSSPDSTARSPSWALATSGCHTIS